jgi:GNAT superfamily N-acetyltransferase
MTTAVDPHSLSIRQLTRDELDQVIDWAAGEGWNPGPGDADAFWAADPDGYMAIERDGELVGAGSVVSYGGRYGFMGLFIVLPELRGVGIGRQLWFYRRDALRDRLEPGAAIGMEGVFKMQPFYAKGGFHFMHRTLRMRSIAESHSVDGELVPLSDLPFEEVSAFDSFHFGVPREGFLRNWIMPEGGAGLGVREDGKLRGIGVVRPCREGYKVGPLFAEDEAVAERIFRGLSQVAAGEQILLDVPECNAAAMGLAVRHEMVEVFGCARMYLGDPPPTPWPRIFGVTTLELG